MDIRSIKGVQITGPSVKFTGHSHSVINHCDRHFTLLSDTDTSFCLFNLFIYFHFLLGDSKQHSKGKGNFEDICNRTKDITVSKSPR
jgi:hypothetical protein